ncbi:MAG: hypothetical protein N2253_02150 [Bacteroidia bacterium]|nr:hypothetical protein [Bacteroidia bacterium]
MMWIFTPTATGQISIQLTSSTTWTGLVVYQGGTFDPTTNTLTGGSCIAYEQSPSSNKTLRLCVQAGQTYYGALPTVALLQT